jgi:DNA-directed RNA polymerase subunit alpha
MYKSATQRKFNSSTEVGFTKNKKNISLILRLTKKKIKPSFNMAILNFQKPDKIVLQKATDFEGQFEFRPLEPGYGLTIGNALRRVLLNSLEGYAITGIKIEGVDHEFATVKGVTEDVTEMILNLKQVRFRKKVDHDVASEKVLLGIKGKTEFTAGMISEGTHSFEVMNPELVICTMDPSARMDIEITIARGRGYIPAEENKLKDTPFGYIPVDSIHTPIKNVKYAIENYRVEQRTDYEKLVLDVSTDGTINPEDAVKQASRILIQHLMIITDENITFDSKEDKKEDVVDEQVLQLRKVLKTPLEDLDLSVRAFNCLKAAKINSLSELVQYEQEDLMKFRNFGQKSLSEIEQVLSERGLHFGMDLSKLGLDDLDR